MNDRETIIEIGFAVFAALLLAALGVLLGGRSAGGASHSRGNDAPPPTPGAIPPERHQARGMVSPR